MPKFALVESATCPLDVSMFYGGRLAAPSLYPETMEGSNPEFTRVLLSKSRSNFPFAFSTDEGQRRSCPSLAYKEGSFEIV